MDKEMKLVKALFLAAAMFAGMFFVAFEVWAATGNSVFALAFVVAGVSSVIVFITTFLLIRDDKPTTKKGADNLLAPIKEIDMTAQRLAFKIRTAIENRDINLVGYIYTQSNSSIINKDLLYKALELLTLREAETFSQLSLESLLSKRLSSQSPA